MKRIIIATSNEGKMKEFRRLLAHKNVEILSMHEAGIDIDIDENGTTFEENAAKKAEAIMRATGRATIADDSGLCVDYLDGAPGIYTARYAGENAGDGENLDKLLRALEGVPPQERTARFVCVIALAEPGKETRFFRGECRGRITQVKKGEGGFGYDPVFYTDQYARTLAELEPYIKNAISHRSAALRAFRDGVGE